MAPEYYFSYSCNKHVVQYETKTSILADLAQLSRTYRDMLFIPGSISYCKKLITPTKDRSGKYGGALVGHNLQLKKTFICHNTAYVFFNGNKLHSYRKIEDANEVIGYESAEGTILFVPGAGNGVFNCKTLRCGIELCADHAAGRLSENAAGLDCHFITSASVLFNPHNSAVRVGGFVFHCDSANDPKVYKNIGGTMTDVSAESQIITTRAYLDQNPSSREAVEDLRKLFVKSVVDRYKDTPIEGGFRKRSMSAQINRYLETRGGKLGIFQVQVN